MTNVLKTRYALPLLLVAGLCIVPRIEAQADPARKEKVVALKPDGCAAVTEGDIVTFEWNPALDHFTGPLSNFHLVFGKLEDGGIRRRGDRVTLSAIPVRGQGTSVGEGVSAPRNGISQMSFRVYLRGASAGEYDLMEARAETSTEQTVAGTTPAMTNSPLRYHFCLDVVTAPQPREGR